MLPTYEKQWEFLREKYSHNQLSHAYVFSGNDPDSLRDLAKELVKLINCLGKKAACHECQNCKLIEKEVFPDLMVVKSANSPASVKNEKDSLEIQMEQIKGVNNFLSITSYYGGVKAVIFEHAERMNRDAQDAFLKNLEEPKGNTLIILVSSKPEMLLPTISSRCQLVKFFGEKDHAKEDEAVLRELLPLLNADLAEKFQYVKKANLEGNELNVKLQALLRYFRNLLLTKLGVERGEVGNYSIPKLKEIISLIEKTIYQMATTNVNPKLALEIILLEI